MTQLCHFSQNRYGKSKNAQKSDKTKYDLQEVRRILKLTTQTGFNHRQNFRNDTKPSQIYIIKYFIKNYVPRDIYRSFVVQGLYPIVIRVPYISTFCTDYANKKYFVGDNTRVCMIFTRLKYKNENNNGYESNRTTLFLKGTYSLLALKNILYVIYTKLSFLSTARVMRCCKSRKFRFWT